MSRCFILLRYTVLALAAFAFFIFAPAGRPQENMLNYARRQIDTLTEFDLTELGAVPSHILFPQVPTTDTGFTHNLKQRRVICVLPGDELYVFEAITLRTLDSLVDDNIAQVRDELENINTLANRRDKLTSQMDERAGLLDDLLGALRRQRGGSPGDQSRQWCRAAAAFTLEQAKDERELVRLEVDSKRQSILYQISRLNLSAVLNTATTGEDLSLLSLRDPEIINRQLIALLTDESEDIAARLRTPADELAALHLREGRLVTEVFGLAEDTDAGAVLESIASGDSAAVGAVLESPSRFAELIEVETGLATASARERELGALLVEVNATRGEMMRHGVHLSAIQRVTVSPREFDVPRLSRTQLKSLSNAKQWELGQWTVFLRSLAASFGTAGGRAVSIPPPQGVFSGPKRIRLSPNEVPAFLAAASQLPSDDYDRIAELLELASSEYASAEAAGGEEAAFWEFISYCLQDTARRGLTSGSG